MIKKLKRSAFVLLCLLLSAGHLHAFEQTVYIWQRSWDRGINDSIKELSSQTEKFSVLSATVSSFSGRPSISKVNANLTYLRDSGKPIILAIRMLSSCGKFINGDKAASSAEELSRAVLALLDEARVAGIVVAGVQFDYDSPTSKLAYYGEFLAMIQKKLPDVRISITTLPSWMDSPAFSKLVSPLEFYVLQLHSLETPKSIDESYLLFDINRSRRYVEQALKVGQKFFVSLPTYGYEVAFDENGKFVGLRAENSRVRWGEDVQLKVVMSDPDKVAEFFKELKMMPNSLFSGVYWFRLPVQKDDLNWGVKTIQAVMAGKMPSVVFQAGSEMSQDGAVDVYVENSGEKDLIGKIYFDVLWDSDDRPLFDLLGSYEKHDLKDGRGVRIIGPAPKVGDRRVAAWFRGAKKDAPLLKLKTTKVMIYDDQDDQ